MKTTLRTFCLVLISAALLWNCQRATDQISDTEKEEIITEVRSEYEAFIAAASRHDVDAIMQYQWNSQDYIYCSNGSLTKGWEAMLELVTSIHTNPYYQSLTNDLDEVIVRVIDREAATVSSVEYLNNFPTQEGPASIRMVVTCLMEKIDGKWVVTVGHESTQEDLSKI